MDTTYTLNNGKTYQKKSRKNASFSQAALNKTDVGEFQAGYFVMADATKENQPHKPTKNRTPERYTERHSRPSYQRSHSDLLPREGDSIVSYERITSPSRSPNKNRRSPQHYHDLPVSTPIYTTSPTTSPSKPRKASAEKRIDNNLEQFSLESSSPKERSPPTSNRWAGPAFSNAPPPSSLPLPDFPPFVSPSSSPPSSQPIPAQNSPPQPSYTEIYYPPQPPAHPPSHTSHPPLVHYYSYPVPASFPYYPPSSAPSLTQLSMDLRRMLNITETQPIPA